MKIIKSQKMNYTLYKDNEKLFLSIVCGTIGIFEKKVYLTQEQIQKYKELGESYIEKLANEIRYKY